MFKYQQLIKAHLDDIAKLITVEQVLKLERQTFKEKLIFWFRAKLYQMHKVMS